VPKTLNKNIVTFAEYEDFMDVEDVVVRSNFMGKKVRVSDIATVSEDFEEPKILTKANGKMAVALVLYRQNFSDDIHISENIHERLRVFRKRLPPGVDVDIMHDASIQTKNSLKMMIQNGMLGFILVLLVMSLFLDYRTAFWTALGIPVTVLGSFIFFQLFDIRINVMTLMAIVLVLGMLVDDAIVIAESICQSKEREGTPEQATLEGINHALWPVITAVLTTVFAFLPILYMTGNLGKVLHSVPIVVTIMLLLSLFEPRKKFKRDELIRIIRNF